MKAPVHAIALIATFCAFGQEAQQTKAESPLAEAARAVSAVAEARASEPAAAETKPAEAKPAEPTPVVETKPIEVKPVEPAPVVETKPIEVKPEEPAPAPMPAEAKPVAPVPAAPAKVETEPIQAKPAEDKTTNAATARDTTDEIDLDEVDDSAEARASEPVVTASASSNKVTLVDISCDNATLEDVLRQFRKVTDANIISDDSTNLQRRVSVNLHHVAWLDGLQSILNSRNYRLEERGDIFFVREDKVLEPVLTKSFTLNHASAKEPADLFNQAYGKKDVKGTVILPIASSFDAANVVVVTATEKIIGECESIIRATDKAVAQIYIEARFLELSSEAMHKLGLQWNKLESWGASVHDIKGGWEYNNGNVGTYSRDNSSWSRTSNLSRDSSASSSRSSAAETPTYSSSTTRGSSSGININRAANTLGPDTLQNALVGGVDMAWRNARGFSGQISANEFGLALSAFESLGEGKIFSNPKVIVSNGKIANVDMTTKYPNISLTSQRNNTEYGAYLDMSAKLEQIPGDMNKGLFAGSCFFEWGITLTVKPRISPDGLISVEITPTISQLDYDVSQDGSGFYTVQSDVSIGLFPIISMKRISTDFTMKDGSTAVIGGLSRTSEDDVDTGIPYLRKIPWIGQKLFGWKKRQKVQKEIIICVTLGIANPSELPKEIGLPKNAVMAREYISGAKMEPGDRTTLQALELDMRTLDEQRRSQDREEGTVRITPAS